MADAKHDHTRRLFEAALELPATARAGFLDKKCGSDLGLRARVSAMIAAAASGSGDAAQTAHPPGDGDGTPLREGPGTRIGPYKLLQQIGEGGFGVVFLAAQEQPVQRRVALKIIKLGMDTRQVVARFEQERQALAMMDHPNIARVLDAGATDTGRPYFVMELCKGQPIVEYCDARNLTIAERLELMAQVCGAVQHAHGKGIIHRDLKPSNILVGTQDDRPQAKVIDFGIAKATAHKLTDKTLFTMHEQVIGTLQYMSPEQAEGSLDIDTRSDVYSLGVLLYELLTGSTPFDRRTFDNALQSEIHRMIREVEPHKPSTRISDSHDALATIAARRRIEPRRLGLVIRGELDWIVMKALEKDRARRYETANGLAQDIRRYLGGEAVLAAPASAAYRLRKVLRRHRGAVAAAAGIAGALLAGVIAFGWQASIARDQRDDAVVARQAETAERAKADRLAAAENQQRLLAESNERRAAANERKADATNRFLVQMLGSANLHEAGRDAKVAQVLDRAAATVGTAFRDQPEVEVTVRRILGNTYLSLGMLDEAAPHLDAALQLDRQVHGEQSTDFVRSLESIATCTQQRGDPGAAATTFERAIGIATEIAGADAELTLSLQVQHANCLVQLQRDDEAETSLRASLAALTRTVGRGSGPTLIAINSLAVLLHRRQRLEEAEPLYREAVELGTRSPGAEHPDTLTARANLASVMQSRGDLTGATPLLAGTYASVKKVFGDHHPKTGGVANLLAQLYADQGRFQDALPLFEESLASRRRAEGERTIGVAQAKSKVAMTLARLGELSRAIALLREVVDGYTSLLGAEHADTLLARLDLTNTLVKDKQLAAAETLFEELLRTCPQALGDDHPATIIATNSYAVMLMAQERFADAEPWLAKALAVGRRVQGEDHKNTLITELNHLAAWRETGRHADAAAAGPDLLARFEEVFGRGHPNTAVAHSSYAQTLIKLGRNDEANDHLQAAIGICKASTGTKNPTFAGDAILLGRLLVDTGRASDAEPVLGEVEAVYVPLRGADHRQVAMARIELGRCRARQQRFADAEALLSANLPVLVRLLPANWRDVQRTERYLAELYTAWNQAEPDPARAAKAKEWQARADARR